MYCPKCATLLSDEQKFCRDCGFDLQIVSRALAHQSQEEAPDQPESADSKPLKSRRTKMEWRGLLMLFSALMVGCLIPIGMGLFPNWAGLNQLIMVLGGVAGFSLFSGILLLVYSDYLPKTQGAKEPFRVTLLSPPPKSVPTNQLPPAGQSEPVASVTESTTGLLADVTHKRNLDRE
ncbi:MAG: zinc-ribbon domain-containing protein [Acidobacteriota bacterium]